jgi:hypothetical protein
VATMNGLTAHAKGLSLRPITLEISQEQTRHHTYTLHAMPFFMLYMHSRSGCQVQVFRSRPQESVGRRVVPVHDGTPKAAPF